MKKCSLLLIMLLSTLVYSQEKVSDLIEKKDKNFSFYYGSNISFNDDINLNKKLRNSNLPEFKKTIGEFLFGVNYFDKHYSGDLEFGATYSNSEKGNYKSKLTGGNLRLRAHYNIVNKDKFAFTSGLSLAYSGIQYDIFSKSNNIDLNNLDSGTNLGHVNFTNEMLYLGPSSSFYFFKLFQRKFRKERCFIL